VLFDQHPKGQKYLGKWEGMGQKKIDVPSYDLIAGMFSEQPTVLILDEYQTWYEGRTNSKQYPWRNWAFNFI
jgi:SpoVK/Ycf46/Vps4 family AAA+-type ATPase